MKKWDDITDEYLKEMPMNFLVCTGKSNDEYCQAIRRVPGGWVYYDKQKICPVQTTAVFVPEVKVKKTEKMTREAATEKDADGRLIAYHCHICLEAVIEHGDNFCPHCGTPLSWEE
jgi:hypothetical protein